MKKHWSKYLHDRIERLEIYSRNLNSRLEFSEKNERVLQEKFQNEKLRRQIAENELQESKLELARLRFENQQLRQEYVDQRKLQDALHESNQQVKKLEKALNIRTGREEPYGLATPSSKRINKENSSAENQKKRGGAKPEHKGHGRRDFTDFEVDRIIIMEEAPLQCECGGFDWKRDQVYSHSVYYFVPARVEKHIYRKRQFICSTCGRNSTVPTPGVMRGCLYSNSMIASMLTEHYLHGHTVGELEERWGINHGTFFKAAHRTALSLERHFEYIIDCFRNQSKLAYADETPWRMDGASGYAWFFGNDEFKVFIFRHTRGSVVPKMIFGPESLDIDLVTDRYGGYTDDLPVRRQYCYVHLLRDIKKMEKEFPDEDEVLRFSANMKKLLSEAVSLRTKDLNLQDYLTTAARLKSDILENCLVEARHPAVQNIQNIFRENPDKLFQWVRSPDIPADNNYAERALRPTVISRKISFGSQSEKGLKTREILMTVIHTAQAQGHDPAVFLRKAMDMLAENKPADIAKLLFSEHKSQKIA